MSKTKQIVPHDFIKQIFRKHELGEVSEIYPLSGGMYNIVLKVITRDNSMYAVKIAPQREIEVLTYEQNLLKSEIQFLQMLADVKRVRFPKIFGYDYSSESPYAYLIMEFLEGKLLSSCRLPKELQEQILYDLGAAMAEMHSLSVSGGFGYIQNGLQSSWKLAYQSMIDNVIHDADRQQMKIPYRDAIQQVILRHQKVMEEVTTPSLVHFDLWKGNILFHNGKLSALIDCERAMYGDIMGDFISLDYVAPFDINKNRSLIDGYNSVAGNCLSFSDNEMLRLYLMKIYLGLIVSTEAGYRHRKTSPEFFSSRALGKIMIGMALKEIRKIENK